MVKHFTSDEADAGSIPADILYIILNYLILNKDTIMKSYSLKSLGEVSRYTYSWLLIHTLLVSLGEVSVFLYFYS
jgi:hypothetical protein